MSEEEPEKKTHLPKRRRHLLQKIFASLVLFSVLSYFALFFGFNYFGERFLRDFLQKKIQVATKGLYRVDFRRMNFNIMTGKVTIDSFALIPDTQVYNRLKLKGKISNSLYQVFINSFTIDRIHFWQIYDQHRVTLRQLLFERPQISIVGFPDTATARKARWRVIYDDIYPAVSGLFKDFHIDSVVVNHGLLLTSFRQKTGKLSTGEYEFSTILRDVSVNPFSYYNRERVFYSRDIDWMVHNFEYIMADSLYFIKASELGFSLSRSRLYGKNLSMRPNFSLRGLHNRPRGDFFQFFLPAFSIEGINLYEALIEKKVKIQNLALTNFSMKIYHNLLVRESSKVRKKKEKFKIARMYTIISGALRSVAIDTLLIRQAAFEYYAFLDDHGPELRIGSADLDLIGFYLDSTAHLDKRKILYARDIDLSLQRFNLRLRDKVHVLSAARIGISTAKSQIEISDGLIFPDKNMDLRATADRKNTISLLLPRVVFSRINLKKLFNYRDFDFDRLEIQEPDFKLTRYRAPKNNDPRFKRPEDFFTEENEDFVYDLLKKYVYVVKGNSISIQNGHGMFLREQDQVSEKIAGARFDLDMQQFLIDSVHGLNQQGYFYSRDFSLDLRGVTLTSPDGMRHLKIWHAKVITTDSLIEAEEISFDKAGGPGYIAAGYEGRPPVSIDFTLQKLRLTGLNHRKLFLDKVLKANVISLEEPSLRLKTENNPLPEGPAEETALLHTDKFIRDFEVGRMVVRHGAFSYDGLENRKASYFSLKDVDFGLLNARVHLPLKDKKDGLISFDSLQLKVFPFRAVFADSNYALECRELDVHSYPADITFYGLKLTPLRKLSDLPEKKMSFSATIPEAKVTGFYFDRAIFDNEWIFDNIRLQSPVFAAELRKAEAKSKTVGDPLQPYVLHLPPFMETLRIRTIEINNAEMGVLTIENGKQNTLSLKGILLRAKQVKVDSVTRSNPQQTPLFNTENIEFSASGFSRTLKDSLYTFSFRRFGFSSNEKTAFVDSVTLTSNFNRTDFPARAGFETDQLELKIPRIDLERVNFRRLLAQGRLYAGNFRVSGMRFSSYRDKRVNLPAGPTPLMPQQMIRKINFPAQIDTITITGAFAAYEEQTGSEPGRLFFDQMNLLVTGFSTMGPVAAPLQSAALNVHGTAALMGKTRVEALFWFPLDHPRDSFTLRASVGWLDLRELNPMLTKLLPVSVARGVSPKTEIKHIHANNNIARGFMDMNFYGLRVSLDKPVSSTIDKLEQSVLTEVANILLPDNNPNDNGRMRTGVVYFERNKSKGFFNFVWKSTLSGIKSTAGFNTKIQRQIRRAEKKMKQ